MQRACYGSVMIDDKARADIQVSGKVQGVSFRAATMERAQGLGVVGWVANRDDGSVQIVAEGSRDALEELITWCRQGPPAAQVADVTVRWEAPREDFSAFDIRG